MINKYRPSNGTEGESFFCSWCYQCARDKSMSEGKDFDDCADDEKCDLIANSMAYDIDHQKYPAEWCYDKDGHPCCTAFVQVGDPVLAPRDELTIDMFETSTTGDSNE